jgi:2-methylisocitrate lyase-like PEP mutase family enzyme
MRRTERMRALISRKALCISPGIYDGYSARLSEAMGFETASVSGAGLANARFGKAEEIGLMSLMENVEACRHIANCVAIPVMADADTGYGNAVTVHHSTSRTPASSASTSRIKRGPNVAATSPARR